MELSLETGFKHYAQPPVKIEIEFAHLRLRVNDKHIIRDVSGRIHHSTTVAIMGPSGAGKTSLMNLLFGSAHYGTCTGTIKINRQRVDINSIRDSAGYVPQDDIVHSNLTVYENLFFAASFMSSDTASVEKIKELVDEIIDVLLLNSARDTVVGDAEKRGISGGQRKRVNIGL